MHATAAVDKVEDTVVPPDDVAPRLLEAKGKIAVTCRGFIGRQ